jgi:hypothetical protein
VSMAQLCDQTLTVMAETETQGPGMGRKVVWTATERTVKARVVAQNSQVLIALLQQQPRAFFMLYFAVNPALNPLLNRVIWRGQVLRLLGPPLDAHGLGRIWTVQAAMYGEDQPTRP